MAVLRFLLDSVWQLFNKLFGARQRSEWVIKIGAQIKITTQERFKMRVTREDTIKIEFVLLTDKGNPARIDGPVRYTAQNPDVATVDADGNVTWVSDGAAGFLASADANLLEGEDNVRLVESSGVLEFVEPEGTRGELKFNVT